MSVEGTVTELTSNKRKRDDGTATQRPHKQSRTSSEDLELSGSRDTSEQETTFSRNIRPNKHSKKERKQNRSTRIHSLRKLLSRDKLPSTVRQEKERELNALLHEQNKVKTKKQDRKVLEKYHYVRFVERSKAEKRLKQLRKQQDATEEDLSAQIHEMEVNRSYAIYAPLAQKYVSIFATSQNNDGSMKKPDMWYQVEKAMSEGEKALLALREGKPRQPAESAGPKDLDSRSRDNKKLESRSLTSKAGTLSAGIEGVTTQVPVEVSDEEMSDGGFFEK